MTKETLNRIKEKLIGMSYEDHEGIWEITDINAWVVTTRQMQNGEDYGREYRVDLDIVRDRLKDRYPQWIEDEAKEALIGKTYEDEDGIWNVISVEEDFAQVRQMKEGSKDFGREYDVLVDEVEDYLEG